VEDIKAGDISYESIRFQVAYHYNKKPVMVTRLLEAVEEQIEFFPLEEPPLAL
jgi:hypothetical protein